MKRLRKRNPKILPIRIYGDKTLRKKAKEIDKIDDNVADYIEDLTETMYVKDGVGLASTQVGEEYRIFVYDPQWSKTNKRMPIVVINPRILNLQGITTFEEGCLSLPRIYANVKRAETIEVEYRDENFEIVRRTLTDMESIIFQHEYDHLDGILFVDHLNKISKIKINRLLKRLEASTDENGINLDSYITNENF